MKKNSKIYVAGHTGLVGSTITGVLREKGFDNLLLKTARDIDLTDQNAADSFFRKEKPEYVFLAAARVGGILANNTLRADFIYDNIMIQSNVIHAAWKYGVKKLLFLGSTCIYPKNAPQPLKEDYLLTDLLEYTNEPYAVAKIAGLKMCESYNTQYGTNFIPVMPSNLYGTADNFDLRSSHVLPALMRKFHLGKCLEINDRDALRKDLERRPVENVNGKSTDQEITAILEKHGIMMLPGSSPAKYRVTVAIWGTGTPLREFMHSKDMVEACVFIMENIDVEGIKAIHKARNPDPAYHPPHFLNIGTGQEISISDLASKIKALCGFSGEVVFDASKPDGTMRKVTDISVLKSLGFNPKITLDEGLAVAYKEYLKYL